MIAELAIGLVAGALAGVLGVGGGVIFVPALVILLGFDTLAAEATSLLAIIPGAVVGTLRHRRYGNVELREGFGIGALAAVGALGGVALANVLPPRVIEIAFAVLLLATAAQLVRKSVAAGEDADAPGRDDAAAADGSRRR